MVNIDEMTYTFNVRRRKFDYCKTGTKCSVKGCNNPIFCKGYCTKHYAQIQRYGKIITTIYDKNKYYGRFGFKGIIYTTNTFNTEQETIDATIKLKKEVNKKRCNIIFSF